jgi:hypothetical protein
MIGKVGSSLSLREFDSLALFAALDDQRLARALSWRGVADAIWEMSSALNAERPTDHPISPATLTGMGTREATSCQHALFMLHWLGRTPESFLAGSTQVRNDTALPPCASNRRLRWSLKQLYVAMDEQRRAEGLTWPQLASILRCTASQLTGLRTARFATNMALAMRITQWLDRPAADFIRAAGW